MKSCGNQYHPNLGFVGLRSWKQPFSTIVYEDYVEADIVKEKWK
jgi:hypothetical protein